MYKLVPIIVFVSLIAAVANTRVSCKYFNSKSEAQQYYNEEELAIFDLLNSEVELSSNERKEVKQIAKALLEKL